MGTDLDTKGRSPGDVISGIQDIPLSLLEKRVIRVYELANLLKINSLELISHLNAHNIMVRTPVAGLTQEQVRSFLSKQSFPLTAGDRSRKPKSPTVSSNDHSSMSNKASCDDDSDARFFKNFLKYTVITIGIVAGILLFALGFFLFCYLGFLFLFCKVFYDIYKNTKYPCL